ncbi:MAG TPA: response regulator [Thermoanaerobaculia bacterium]|nr:response regulator [Thermoanaerobaculia bacterium]
MEKKILVADDSLTIQKVLELTFADSDYRLTCVSNGRLALERVHAEPPDVILADVVMPEKNGYEVCEEIKKNPETARIPVILLAGTFEPFDRDRARRLGCDAIVSKPFDSRELYRKVESLVAGRSEESSDADRVEKVAVASEPTAPPVAAVPAEPSAPSPFVAAPNPFDAGFAEEDFTGSIRTLRAGRGEPLANLYGPEDVESALAAFREVEPTARATDWRGVSRAPQPSPAPLPPPDSPAVHLDTGEPAEQTGEIEESALPIPGDDGHTQRIDVSEFREAPPQVPRGGSTIEVVRTASESPPETSAVPEFPPPAQPFEPPPSPRPGSDELPPARDLSDAEIERLAEKLAAKLVEKLSDRIVREVAWEVVPETAELVVRERLRELESGVE